jgi:NADPH:quinone reductase-like Zn-dependent oxidoreductase
MRTWELDGGLRLAERDEPRPGAGEVLVAIRAAALNYRDLIVHDQHQGPRRVPASDGAGEVLAVGPGFDAALAPGDRVVGAFFPDGSGARLAERCWPGRWAGKRTACWPSG